MLREGEAIPNNVSLKHSDLNAKGLIRDLLILRTAEVIGHLGHWGEVWDGTAWGIGESEG